MLGLKNLIEVTRRQREEDKEKWKNLDWDLCQVCGEKGSDRRTLFIQCFYNMKEVSPKFLDLSYTKEGEKGYALRLCKGCRSTLLFDYLIPFIKREGRLIHNNLDDDGILSFNSKEEFMRYKRR